MPTSVATSCDICAENRDVSLYSLPVFTGSILIMNSLTSKPRSRIASVLRDTHFWIPLGVLIAGLFLLSHVSHWSLP
jgi:hypothetical protein